MDEVESTIGDRDRKFGIEKPMINTRKIQPVQGIVRDRQNILFVFLDLGDKYFDLVLVMISIQYKQN